MPCQMFRRTTIHNQSKIFLIIWTHHSTTRSVSTQRSTHWQVSTAAANITWWCTRSISYGDAPGQCHQWSMSPIINIIKCNVQIILRNILLVIKNDQKNDSLLIIQENIVILIMQFILTDRPIKILISVLIVVNIIFIKVRNGRPTFLGTPVHLNIYETP